MKLIKKISQMLAIATLILSTTPSAHAGYFCQCWPGDMFGWGYLDITNGYRRDKITCDINSFADDGTPSGTNSLKLSDIQLYQLGLQGKWTICNFLVYAEADWGCGNTGNYHEFSTAPGEEDIDSKGLLHDCMVGDFNIGTGYLFWITDYWNCGWGEFAAGPTAGWSYHHQRVKTKKVETNNVPNFVLDDLKYRQNWQGPWVGADLVFEYYRFCLNAGYEYHWAHWHAAFDLDGPDVIGVAFSDRRKSTNATANVVYLDIMWNYCYYWNIGVGAKYQQWKSNGGIEYPAHDNFILLGTDKVKQSEWTSYDITFNIGYTF